jgi:seryl-tRNA synthetase
MLDVKYIKENKDKVQKAIVDKGVDLNLDELLKISEKRAKILQEIEELNSLKNDINELVKDAKTESEKQGILEKGKEIKIKLNTKEPELKEVSEKYDELMVRVPTVPSEDTPVGKGDESNKEIDKWGEVPKFNFKLKDHIQLGKDLDILDIDEGVKVSGFRGYYVKNEGVSLIMGIMMLALSKMIEKGYRPMLPPTLVKEFVLFGSGFFRGVKYDPKVDEVYQIASSDKEADGKISKEKKFLIGTAEPSLLAYYSGKTLKEEELPIRVCGYSPCYRSEIGSYGKDTKGLYRVHEFMKVEQVVISKADIEESKKLQDEMVEISREMYRDLGLPHRLVQVCTGEMGVGKYRMFDIETWIPSRNAYSETGSASNLLDWQARRLNIKYADKLGRKKFAYLLNNTALPSIRPFIAILENYQQADGSVKVPETLQGYMPGNIDIIHPVK